MSSFLQRVYCGELIKLTRKYFQNAKSVTHAMYVDNINDMFLLAPSLFLVYSLLITFSGTKVFIKAIFIAALLMPFGKELEKYLVNVFTIT